MNQTGIKHAVILAAGRGERMRPLTDDTPKPLLSIGEHALIEKHLLSLAAMEIQEVVINVCWQAEKIIDYLGNGKKYALNIRYSVENDGVLETGGGIFSASQYLDCNQFLVINGDIWTEYVYRKLPILSNDVAHLVLVPNPAHKQTGDFGLKNSRVTLDDERLFTFSGISVIRRELFEGYQQNTHFALLDPLMRAIENNRVSGEIFEGRWVDVGTPQRLNQARDLEKQKKTGRC